MLTQDALIKAALLKCASHVLLWDGPACEASLALLSTTVYLPRLSLYQLFSTLLLLYASALPVKGESWRGACSAVMPNLSRAALEHELVAKCFQCLGLCWAPEHHTCPQLTLCTPA